MQSIIDDYKIYYGKLDEKYKEFDKQGSNKSISILNMVKKEYISLSLNIQESYKIYFSLIESIVELIKNSKNYIEIPYEELELCVSIIVVDSFIRCKIFKNPGGYNHVVTR